MTFVDHDQSTVLVGEVANSSDLSDIAVHRKHAVGHNDFEAMSCFIGGLKLLFQVRHVVVGVAVSGRLAQADSIDDGGMV